ncbi:hypothetical protein B0H11DRAFT_1905766 [Mycena galericulata]|nr:hypothetical protein B0H11DRAFT_1905766 [Mycena galericulata]
MTAKKARATSSTGDEGSHRQARDGDADPRRCKPIPCFHWVSSPGSTASSSSSLTVSSAVCHFPRPLETTMRAAIVRAPVNDDKHEDDEPSQTQDPDARRPHRHQGSREARCQEDECARHRPGSLAAQAPQLAENVNPNSDARDKATRVKSKDFIVSEDEAGPT